MSKKQFVANDFSGGVNGFLDPQNIAENELAKCIGFQLENGTLSILGDMKATYTPASANGSDPITIESGYGLFAFTHDYDKDGDLNTTQYLVLMDGITFDTYDDDGDAWLTDRVTLGTAALTSPAGTGESAGFGGSVKPCFYIVDGAFRISPGNFAAGVNAERVNNGSGIASTTIYGDYQSVAVDIGTASDHVTVGDTIEISGQEAIVLRVVDNNTVHIARNMTGTFPGTLADNAIANSLLDTRWRGVVQRKNFNKVTTIGTFTDWYSSFAHPRPPVEHHTDIDHDVVVPDYTYPFLVNYADESTDVTIDGDQSPCIHIGYQNGTPNDSGLWNGASITLYTTALYDEAKQESQPNKGDTFTVAANKELAVWIGVEYSDDGSAYRMHKRATGARVYYEDSTNDPGTLFQLLEISFEKGCKIAGAEVYTDWSNTADASGGIASGDTDEACECPFGGTNSGADASDRTTGNAFIFESPPKVVTYEINTGYQAHVNTHARYKTATICNRRLFVGNVYQSGVAHGDRMLSSPPNKFDILPETNFIDVAVGDGDEIVKLESFADRILQFKKRALYIINAGGSLGQEYLESEHKNMGVENPSQTCMTEFGVAWVNSKGVFLYDGQKINDLTKQKLKLTDTTSRYKALNVTESNVPLIGYHATNKWLVIHLQSNVTGAYEDEAWIFDFKVGGWTKGKEFTHDSDYKSNMVWTPDNELVFAAGTNSSNNPDIFKYQISTSCDDSDFGATGSLGLLTKDYDLGAPGIKKKLRSVYITYSAVDNSYIEADIIYTHPTGSTTNALEEADSGTTYYTEALGFKSTTGNIRTVELTPTTYVKNAYSFQLKLHNPNNVYLEAADFKLYDIQFTYRHLGVR